MSAGESLARLSNHVQAANHHQHQSLDNSHHIPPFDGTAYHDHMRDNHNEDRTVSTIAFHDASAVDQDRTTSPSKNDGCNVVDENHQPIQINSAVVCGNVRMRAGEGVDCGDDEACVMMSQNAADDGVNKEQTAATKQLSATTDTVTKYGSNLPSKEIQFKTIFIFGFSSLNFASIWIVSHPSCIWILKFEVYLSIILASINGP